MFLSPIVLPPDVGFSVRREELCPFRNFRFFMALFFYRVARHQSAGPAGPWLHEKLHPVTRRRFVCVSPTLFVSSGCRVFFFCYYFFFSVDNMWHGVPSGPRNKRRGWAYRESHARSRGHPLRSRQRSAMLVSAAYRSLHKIAPG